MNDHALSHVDIQSVTNQVYVDDSGLLRRFTMKMTEAVASTGSVTIDKSPGSPTTAHPSS